MDYKIDVCLSERAYDEKPLGNVISRMRWQCKQLTIEEFAAAIAAGHSFCALMQDNRRNRNNFVCTTMLVYDIDHCDTTMGDYLSKLQLMPTMAYTSPSNREGDYGFRLIYLLDFKICTLDEYYTYSVSFSKQLMMKDVDEHSYLGEQYWNGNSHCEMVLYNNILKKDDILIDNTFQRSYSFKGNSTLHSKVSYSPNKEHHNILCASDTFINDYWNLSLLDILTKYDYPNQMKTNIEYSDDDPIIYYPEDYIEITRPWKKINGETLKISDGNSRRKKLYTNALLRRAICPDITFDNLLYNIVWEFYHYYLNDGNRIDKKTLYDIVNNAMQQDIDLSRLKSGKPRYKFFVNRRYCEKYNMTPQQVMGKLRNKKQYIGGLYDPSLTDQQNVDVMKEYGLKIAVLTLKRWRKENNITKYKK